VNPFNYKHQQTLSFYLKSYLAHNQKKNIYPKPQNDIYFHKKSPKGLIKFKVKIQDYLDIHMFHNFRFHFVDLLQTYFLTNRFN
jgi:hypothetical protein